MTGVTIRAAVAGDFDRLGELFTRCGFGAAMADLLAYLRAQLDGEAFVADLAGRPVGAAGCIAFGASGWIGAVVVAPEQRRRGLGGALTRTAAGWLTARGARTVSLHATELGRPVYRRLGFVAEGEWVTLIADAAAPRPAPPWLRPGRPDDLPAVLALDRGATGEDRCSVLRATWPQRGLVAEDGAGRLRGFYARRPARPSGGATIAVDLEVGVALRLAGQTPGEPEYASLPAGHHAARAALERLGYGQPSLTTRMRLGPPLAWRAELIFGAFNLFWG